MTYLMPEVYLRDQAFFLTQHHHVVNDQGSYLQHPLILQYTC